MESRTEKPIGKIDDLVMDSGGRVRFVVVETDVGFLNADITDLPPPWVLAVGGPRAV